MTATKTAMAMPILSQTSGFRDWAFSKALTASNSMACVLMGGARVTSLFGGAPGFHKSLPPVRRCHSRSNSAGARFPGNSEPARPTNRLVALRHTEVIEQPGFLPDAEAAFGRDLAVFLAVGVRLEITQLRVDGFHLLLLVVDVVDRARVPRHHLFAGSGQPPFVPRHQAGKAAAPRGTLDVPVLRVEAA